MMKRPLALLALAALAFAPVGASATTITGDLNNFDTLNDTGQVCHGFEIEIDDVSSTDITYTYDWNHYGAPKIYEDRSDPLHPKVIVRYESTKDASGNWGANNSYTNPAIPTIVPPSGHSCTDPSVNEGCEHFGLGYYGNPTAIRYSWLIDGGAAGLVRFGSPVPVAAPTFVYVPPPAPGQPGAQVVAAIPAPAVPIPPGKRFGEPSWVKVVKTTTHSANPVELQDLISDDADADGLADWQNKEPDEVETEWYLLQANDGANPAKAELLGAAEDMGDGSETVTRRYEFYRYAAAPDTRDGENGEAMCSEVNPTTDPADPNYLHGVGESVAVTDANGDKYYVNCAAQVVVGNYIGAQMAGFAAAAPLGLIDHLQAGERGTPYTPRTVVVGGNTPFAITIPMGSLPPGLAIDPADGVLSGTPTAGGDFPFIVDVTDADNVRATQIYSLHIAGLPVAQVDLVVAKLGNGSGTVTGNGVDCGADCSVHLDAGTAVALTATAAVGSVFTGWSGPCTGTLGCAFTLEASANVVATFERAAPSVTGAVSRKLHDDAGTFDLPLAPTPANPTTEPRTGGGGGNHFVVFTFDKAVTGGEAAVVAGSGSAGVPTFAGNEMTVPVTGAADAQYVTVAVNNVVAADGGTGGSGSIRVGLLAGDVNGNRSVSLADLLGVNAVLSQPVTGANYLRDVNATGSLTLADTMFVNAALTHALPIP